MWRGRTRCSTASIRLRPELVEFLCQDHTEKADAAATLVRLEELAARLEAGAVAPPVRNVNSRP